MFFLFFQALKELDLNIDADVAFLAGQNPPVKIFPTQNTSHLPYNEQVSVLEADYLKYYSYRGDLKYNEKMVRSIKNEGKGKCSEEDTCMYRVCRDKNRFIEARIKDDVLILGKVLESMIERTSEMEKHIEGVLVESGEKEMPNWDELFIDSADENTKIDINDVKNMPLCDSKATRSVRATKRKGKSTEQKPQPKRKRSHIQNQQSKMTHNKAQMLVAQMILARSFGQPNRVQLPADFVKSVIKEDSKKE